MHRCLQIAPLALLTLALGACQDNKSAVNGGMTKDDKSPSMMDDAAMMQQMMALAEPSAEHGVLMDFAGDWTAEVKFWMDPNQPPSVSTGRMTARPVHGNRFILGDYQGKFMMPGADGKMQEMPFTGTVLWGYNRVEKQYESVWCDSWGTWMLIATGQSADGGNTIVSTAKFRMPAGEGRPLMDVAHRERTTRVSRDRYFMEMWHGTKEHGEHKVMEITYTRAR